MKKAVFSLVFLGALGVAGALNFLARSEQALVFESLESKTKVDAPVYNEVRWFSSRSQDVWMMRQSHWGPHAKAADWDRLAIIIDKTQSPKTARFVQLRPGPLEWKGGEPTEPFRAYCFMCHTNGPRVIRPNWDSKTAPLRLIDRIRIEVWNLRIKTYGRIVAHPSHAISDPQSTVPFRLPGRVENDPLTVQACTRCHQVGGLISRGPLFRQQAITIQFMVERGFMPPPGFSLSASDRNEIQAFIDGL